MKQENKDFQYRVYVTDVLQVIAENTGYMSGAITKHGRAPKKRYADLALAQQKPKEQPKQSGKEIASNIIGGLIK